MSLEQCDYWKNNKQYKNCTIFKYIEYTSNLQEMARNLLANCNPKAKNLALPIVSPAPTPLLIQKEGSWQYESEVPHKPKESRHYPWFHFLSDIFIYHLNHHWHSNEINYAKTMLARFLQLFIFFFLCVCMCFHQHSQSRRKHHQILLNINIFNYCT